MSSPMPLTALGLNCTPGVEADMGAGAAAHLTWLLGQVRYPRA